MAVMFVCSTILLDCPNDGGWNLDLDFDYLDSGRVEIEGDGSGNREWKVVVSKLRFPSRVSFSASTSGTKPQSRGRTVGQGRAGHGTIQAGRDSRGDWGSRTLCSLTGRVHSVRLLLSGPTPSSVGLPLGLASKEVQA